MNLQGGSDAQQKVGPGAQLLGALDRRHGEHLTEEDRPLALSARAQRRQRGTLSLARFSRSSTSTNSTCVATARAHARLD